MAEYTLNNAPVANTAAVVTLAAQEMCKHWIKGIAWSYHGGAPANGNLLVTIAGATVFSLDITGAGEEFVDVVRETGYNEALVVTLSAGGGGVTGKVNVLQHKAYSGKEP